MLPYENATSGKKAVADIEKLLKTFGCNRFGTMMDTDKGELIVQFGYRGREAIIKASLNGYAAAWLKAHPYNYRTRGNRVEYERKAKQIASIAVYSILRDWIKGQVTAIETGVLSFEGAFLGQIMLPSGRTVVDEVRERDLLPALPAPK